jgi:hypothetical protein
MSSDAQVWRNAWNPTHSRPTGVHSFEERDDLRPRERARLAGLGIVVDVAELKAPQCISPRRDPHAGADIGREEVLVDRRRQKRLAGCEDPLERRVRHVLVAVSTRQLRRELVEVAGLPLDESLESGRVNPTWGTVRRIARAHGVDVATIEARTQATDRK